MATYNDQLHARRSRARERLLGEIEQLVDREDRDQVDALWRLRGLPLSEWGRFDAEGFLPSEILRNGVFAIRTARIGARPTDGATETPLDEDYGG